MVVKAKSAPRFEFDCIDLFRRELKYNTEVLENHLLSTKDLHESILE